MRHSFPLSSFVRKAFKLALVLSWLPGFTQPGFAQSGKAPSSYNAQQERVQQLILLRLSKELNLSPAENQELAAALRQSREYKLKLKQDLLAATTALRLSTEAGDKARIETDLSKVNQIQTSLNRADEQMFTQVKPILDPERLARFVLVMDEIRREVREVQRQGTQNAPAAGAPVWVPYSVPAPNRSPDAIWVR